MWVTSLEGVTEAAEHKPLLMGVMFAVMELIASCLKNTIGLPLLSVVSFSVATATLVLGVVHGLTWSDMHRAWKKDPALPSIVLYSGAASLFLLMFLFSNLDALGDPSITSFLVFVLFMFCLFIGFIPNWIRFVKLVETEKANESSPKDDNVYDRMRALRDRATGRKSDC